MVFDYIIAMFFQVSCETSTNNLKIKIEICLNVLSGIKKKLCVFIHSYNLFFFTLILNDDIIELSNSLKVI